VAGALDEDIFEARAGDGDGADFAGEGIEDGGEEAMAVFALQTDGIALRTAQRFRSRFRRERRRHRWWT
jgi:hypothetical protein